METQDRIEAIMTYLQLIESPDYAVHIEVQDRLLIDATKNIVNGGKDGYDYNSGYLKGATHCSKIHNRLRNELRLLRKGEEKNNA